MHRSSDDPLALDADETRRIGYRTVDLLVGRVLAHGPAVGRATPAELDATGDVARELGALDRGAGCGCRRTATVAARTPLRVVVLPDRPLAFAMRPSTSLDQAVRQAFHGRLRRA